LGIQIVGSSATPHACQFSHQAAYERQSYPIEFPACCARGCMPDFSSPSHGARIPTEPRTHRARKAEAQFLGLRIISPGDGTVLTNQRTSAPNARSWPYAISVRGGRGLGIAKRCQALTSGTREPGRDCIVPAGHSLEHSQACRQLTRAVALSQTGCPALRPARVTNAPTFLTCLPLGGKELVLIEQQGQGAKPRHPFQNQRHFQPAIDLLRP
jgi:hypothetical protein